MIRHPNRRDILSTMARLGVASSLGADYAAIARAEEPIGPSIRTLPQLDSVLRNATSAGELPGVVALAATDKGVVYEGVFGRRRLEGGPAMTRDTVFRVAALQLVEQDKLSLDAPVPDIDPALGAPQVLDGFDAVGNPQFRPAKRPISLRHLLTHTAGFSYGLWDAKAVRCSMAIERLASADRN